MRLAMKERKAVTKATAERYVGAGKKEKGRILDEFVVLTRYNRSYARHVLRRGESGKRLRPRESIKRKKVYDEAVLVVLREVWEIMDYICGKRLQSVLAETIRALEQFGEMKLSDETREKLGLISAATIDRLLAAERKKYQLRGGHGLDLGACSKSRSRSGRSRIGMRRSPGLQRWIW